MGYQALLFCPDEKTARTVTQVLSELEFSVEPCVETFAAVKKLMGTHFDAVVVDCDNEQNAALLFKSARNSTSNQTSLAVAVVEGQAGVAKAFRIGANLVLTKPINIEQAKGTLRVARGLLRKGDPAKPGTPAAIAPTTPATAPPKPAAVKPAPPKPVTPAVTSQPRPTAPAAPTPAWPTKTAAAAHSVPSAQDQDKDLPAISVDDKVPAPTLSTPTAAPPKIVAPTSAASVSQASKLATPSARPTSPAAAIQPKPPSKAVSPIGSAIPAGGAASAPAPARETKQNDVYAAATAPAIHQNDAVLDQPAEAIATEPASSRAEPPPPSFTFGGANVPETSGGSKKILLVVAAIVIVAAAAYAGFSYFQGPPSSAPGLPASTPVSKPPVAPLRQLMSAPTSSQPTAVSTPPAASSPDSPPARPMTTAKNSTADSTTDNPDSAPADETSSAAPKKSSNGSPAPSKAAATVAPEPTPLVVNGGAVPKIRPKADVADTAAPSMAGIATPGTAAPPPNLVSSAENAPTPLLQRMNISQGVSQGLLIKKVQPIYPKNALTMHIEGAVQLLATISKAGNITSVKVLSGDPQLASAALEAVKQWKYKPYLLDGEPVEIQTTITLNFKSPN